MYKLARLCLFSLEPLPLALLEFFDVGATGIATNYNQTTGLTPVNTDGTDNPDYLDTDSDNAQGNDTAEAGLTLAGADADVIVDRNSDEIGESNLYRRASRNNDVNVDDNDLSMSFLLLLPLKVSLLF